MRKMMMQSNLFDEWDYDKNKGIDPKTLKRSSEYNAYWKCQVCGGGWQSKVKNRTNGSGCPYCAGRKVLNGFNDLATTHAHIAAQWIRSEHGKTTCEVSAGSHEKVLWECENGHRWNAIVKSRVAGNNCPYCFGRLPIPNKTSLQKTHSELLKDWDWERNTVLPSEVSAGSNKKIHWKCSVCGYRWTANPASRTRRDRVTKSGCPCCNHKVAVPGVNDAATYNPKVAQDWNVERNDGRKLSCYLPSSNHRGWWTCHTCGQTWKAQIQSRVVVGKKCPYCSGKLPISEQTDLKTLYPQIAAQWNYKKNGDLNPKEVTPYSHKRVWWICPDCGETWRTAIANRTAGKGCKYCAAAQNRGK